MNAAETLEIIKTLHAVGASHFKSGDFEISMGLNNQMATVTDCNPVSTGSIPVSASTQENPESTARLKELIGTMQLSPEALADKIFPAGADR